MMQEIFYRMKDLGLCIGAQWDRLAPSEGNAVEFAEKHINKEPRKFKEGSSSAYTDEYCLAHSGEVINERYRGNRPEDLDKQIAATLDGYRTDTNLVVYRGVCDYVYDLMKENARDIEGADLYEKGFMATSLVKGHEINGDKNLRIFIPAGSKCIFMGDVNNELKLYYEVTVQHGAALKIVSIDKKYINCLLIKTA